jgi:uncharacterized protein
MARWEWHMSDTAQNPEPTRSKKWVRLLHTYVSLYSLLLVLFFGATGFMMNHPNWFSMENVRTSSRQVELPVALLEEGDRLTVVEHLRRTEDLRGLVQAYEVERDHITIRFARAGRKTDIRIERDTGSAELHLESKGVAAMLSAIHAGEDTGRLGRRVIDLAALSLVLTALTGLWLWTSVTVRRENGLIWLAAGLAVTASVFFKLLS